MAVFRHRWPLFDLDWTLINGGSTVHREAFLWALKKAFGIEQQIDINLHGMIDSQILFLLALNSGINEQLIKQRLPELIELTDKYYLSHLEDQEIYALPGADKLLRTLIKKGIPVGVLTGNTKAIGQAKLEMSGLFDYVKYAVYSDEFLERYQLVDAAYDQLCKKGGILKKNDLVIIGDTPKDIECARKSSAKSIAVATGKYARNDLNEADLVIDSLEEVDHIIDFLTDREYLPSENSPFNIVSP